MRRLMDLIRPPRPPVLRAATSADAQHLAEIHGRAFRRGWGADEFERLLAERACLAHVASPSPRRAPAGFVLSHVVVPEAEILSIAVVADCRGRGYGRALLDHHLARLASLGVTTSFLEVEATNAAACALYAGAGYREAGRRKGYYATEAGAADALILRRDF